MKIKRRDGFSLAEMLIVVAIVMVLMGVSFVAVQDHQSSMTRLEYDTIAKEIFVAAQNHLTAAQAQGYLQLSKNEYGTKGNYSEDTDSVWYVMNGVNKPGIVDLMLPDYALDGTILSGSYLIRYQPSAGLVLDVFYSHEGKSSLLTKSGTTLGGDGYGYNDLMTGCRGDEKKSARESFGTKKAVIGWYGNENPVERGERLAVPSLEIINAEQLLVKVSDPNDDKDFASLKLIVIGKSSKAEKYFSLVKDHIPQVNNRESKAAGSVYSLVLDDITFSDANGTMHFYDIMKTPDVPGTDGSFFPGEDIIIKAVAYSNTKLANIAMSAEKETNSLFADPKSVLTNGSDVENGTAVIANIRHLENLDYQVSQYLPNKINKTVNPHAAKQLTDLSWKDFISKTNNDNTVIQYNSDHTNAACYYPVSPDYVLAYDGQNHSVSDVKVNFAGDAGLFGSLPKSGSEVSGSEVKNLELIDCEITGTTGAGALIGTAKNTTVTNVLARHTDKADAYKTATVEATGGDAGGLIGTAEACTVEKSAAALVVEGSVSAGGLIGSTTGGSVTGCYSGGHTYSGVPTGAKSKYASHASVYPVRYYDAYGTPLYNVTGATAGGLIGAAGTTTVDKSYSTCSASGTTSAGGFVGTSSGKLTDCYCTGLVGGTDTGAFAYSVSATASDVQGCRYFEIINEKADTVNGGYTCLSALGGSATNANITPFDADASSYNTFTRVPAGDVAEAKPYDADGTAAYGLNAFYTADGKTRYILRTVSDLGATLSADDYVNVHYGDWPAPEEFVFN